MYSGSAMLYSASLQNPLLPLNAAHLSVYPRRTIICYWAENAVTINVNCDRVDTAAPLILGPGAACVPALHLRLSYPCVWMFWVAHFHLDYRSYTVSIDFTVDEPDTIFKSQAVLEPIVKCLVKFNYNGLCCQVPKGSSAPDPYRSSPEVRKGLCGFRVISCR
ncbi:hypothetical protein LZ30DRAFT_691219 [Colletotrichum cereale]|nr:hypothetical protein LZ30DRAFT_691219 [Colletotrichum cereale]